MRDAKRIVVVGFSILLPSGKRLHNYGKIHHFSWENSLKMVIFHSYVNVYQRVPDELPAGSS